MKILFINQFFWPDSSATSQQLTDMAAGLAARGYDVTVLCAEGGYAAAGSTAQPAGVRIVRVKASAFTRGTLGRLLSYFSFYAGALVRGLLLERPDVVISLTTPPVISLIGTMIKIIKGSRHYVWEHDLYPDVALDLNYFKPNGFADRVVGFLADFSRRHADGVIALGECMRQRLIARGIPAKQVLIVENWANATAITPMPRPGNPNELVLLYSGNFGLAHDIDTLASAMLALRPVADEPSRFRFLFVGSGEKRKQLADFCEANAIPSLELRPYVPRDQLSEGLAAGDIGLVTQHEICCGSVVPSKVYGILAAGRPVLFIGPRAATPALIVERHGCGWQLDPGDVTGLTHLLRLLADRPELVQAAGKRARQALVEFYDLPHGVDHMEAILGSSANTDLQPAALPPRLHAAPDSQDASLRRTP